MVMVRAFGLLVAVCIAAVWICYPSPAQDRRKAEQGRPTSPPPEVVEDKNGVRKDAQTPAVKAARPVDDAAADAMVQRRVNADRPEQRVTDHDRSKLFDFTRPAPLTAALNDQPKGGRIAGFDFARDPLNAEKPFTTFEEVYQKESAAKAKVASAQRDLLESRYILKARLDPEAKMSRGKPLPVGPTARPAGNAGAAISQRD
jgi:hypothetical protein